MNVAQISTLGLSTPVAGDMLTGPSPVPDVGVAVSQKALSLIGQPSVPAPPLAIPDASPLGQRDPSRHLALDGDHEPVGPYFRLGFSLERAFSLCSAAVATLSSPAIADFTNTTYSGPRSRSCRAIPSTVSGLASALGVDSATRVSGGTPSAPASTPKVLSVGTFFPASTSVTYERLVPARRARSPWLKPCSCLLYTSDAADEN